MAFPIKLTFGKKHIKKSSIAIPCMFTLANALCGFLSIIESVDGCFIKAAVFIGIAAGLDLCDGRLARALNKVSDIGIQLDSLCDAISFCIAPIILLYNFLDFSVMSFGTIALGSYLCAGLLRLARFNTLSKEQTHYFLGMPTPAAALFLASYIVYYPWLVNHSPWLYSYTGVCSLVIMLAFLMLSNLRFPTFKKTRVTKKQGIIISSFACVIATTCWCLHIPLLLMGMISYLGVVVSFNGFWYAKRLQVLISSSD